MSTDAQTLLKYANLQMAAEAIDLRAGISGNLYINALTKGNNRSSKFTDVQAAQFASEWSVVDHTEKFRVTQRNLGSDLALRHFSIKSTRLSL